MKVDANSSSSSYDSQSQDDTSSSRNVSPDNAAGAQNNDSQQGTTNNQSDSEVNSNEPTESAGGQSNSESKTYSDNEQTSPQTQSQTSTADQIQQRENTQQTRDASFDRTDDGSGSSDGLSGQDQTDSRNDADQRLNAQAPPDERPQASASSRQQDNSATSASGSSGTPPPTQQAQQGASTQQPRDASRGSTSAADRTPQSQSAQQTPDASRSQASNGSNTRDGTSAQSQAQRRSATDQGPNTQATLNGSPRASANSPQYDNTGNAGSANTRQPRDAGASGSSGTPQGEGRGPGQAQPLGTADTESKPQTAPSGGAQESAKSQQHGEPGARAQSWGPARKPTSTPHHSVAPEPGHASQAEANNGSEEAKDPSGKTATELVLSNDIEQKGQEYYDATNRMQDDINHDRDTTDNAIAAAKAFNDVVDLVEQKDPSQDQNERISKLDKAMKEAKPGETIEDIAKRAGISLPTFDSKRKSAADQYGSYGKSASTYTRAVIFDEARFNNSKVLAGTPLARFQRPGQSFMDPIGANGRLGVLTGTRFNAAASNFTKAGTMFMSGIQKMKEGRDPTDDFIGAGAALGQGTTELTAGAMTDFGNHMAKKLASNPPPRAAPEYSNFGSDDPVVNRINEAQNAGTSRIDQGVTERQSQLEDMVIEDMKRRSSARELALQDGVEDIKGQYLEMQELGQSLKKSANDAMNDANENIKSIDERAQPLMEQLKAQGYDTIDGARASQDESVKNTVAQLDNYAYMKQEAYDQFNHAMDEYESIIKKAPGAFGELADITKTTPVAERSGKVTEWAEKYGKEFGKYQNGLLTSTDQLPEWFKISKPLRAQLVPAAISTAFGAVGFGAALDSYLKKQAAGTATEQDRLALAGQVFSFASGLAGFIPVAGPLLSLALATVGLGLSNFADKYQEWKNTEAATKLKEKIREDYEKRTGQGTFGGFDE
ncbi:conserved hypothetical protein [Paraburkholderia sacchari]|uniref:hypothetical protein n=1 Tax=Paraburkholderia sacchari TaxID=159450 RepID=UPI0039A6FBB2